MRFLILILGLCFTFQSQASDPSELRTFGKNAPVQMYLFTSLTCSHCADFHKRIFPTLKKEYADTGKAQIIIVDMVAGGTSLAATQIVRCLDIVKADKLESDLYANQSRWMKRDAADARRSIASYAARQGMTKEQFDSCITDSALQKNIIEQQANLARLYGITGTPTLVVREGTEVRKWSGTDEQIFKELKELF